MAQTLEQGLMDVPILRTMLGLEQFDAQQAASQAATQVGVASAANKLAELQGMPALNQLRQAQAEKARTEAEESREMRNIMSQYEGWLRSGDQPSLEAAHFRAAPGPYVTGQYRDKLSGLPDPMKLNLLAEESERQFAATGDPKYKTRAESMRKILQLRENSARELGIESLMQSQPGLTREAAAKIWDKNIVIQVTPDGRVVATDRVEAARGGAAAPDATGAQAPGVPPSPYKPQPDAPGVRTIIPGYGPQNRLNMETQQLTTRLKDKNIPALEGVVGNIENMFGQYKEGEIPGMGFLLTENPLAEAAIGAAGTEAAKAFSPELQEWAQKAALARADVQAWRNEIVRMSAGLAQTVPEMENARRQLQTAPINNEAAMRNAYSNWKKVYNKVKQQLFSGFDPYVVQEYYAQSGETPKWFVDSEDDAKRLYADLRKRGIEGQVEIKDIRTGRAGASGRGVTAAPAPTPAAAPTAAPAAGKFPVRMRDGGVWTFTTKEAADEFKRKHGI